MQAYLRAADVLFTTVFMMELGANLFAHSLTWLYDWSNALDGGIVLLSALAIYVSVGVPQIKMIRIIKIVRVIRVFRSLKAANRIVSALLQGIIPVLNAFIILIVVTAIYAVLGTHLFHLKSPEYFGNFSKSLFSMMQVVSGDSWASVSRTLTVEDPMSRHAIAFFFVSYFLIGGTVLINIVMTVLLEEFLQAVAREREDVRSAQQQELEACRVAGVLDPLIESVSHFSGVAYALLMCLSVRDPLIESVSNFSDTNDLKHMMM